MTSAITGMKAPDFEGMTTGQNGQKVMNLKEFTASNNWCLLFFFPMPFCVSELLALNSIKKDLDKLNCNLVACSTNIAVIHKRILSVAPEEGGVKVLSFPLLEDVNGDIAEKYGVLHKDSDYTYSYRGYFLIDSDGIIRKRKIVYYVPVGIIRDSFTKETIKETLKDALGEDTIKNALGEDAWSWFETN